MKDAVLLKEIIDVNTNKMYKYNITVLILCISPDLHLSNRDRSVTT